VPTYAERDIKRLKGSTGKILEKVEYVIDKASDGKAKAQVPQNKISKVYKSKQQVKHHKMS
jgi:hypothetical protein